MASIGNNITMFSRLSTTQKGMILVLVPVAFEIIFVAFLAIMLASSRQQLDKIEHSNQALFMLGDGIGKTASACFLLVSATPHIKQVPVDELERTIHTAKTLAGMTADEFPELKELIERTDATRLSMLKLLDKGRQILNDKNIPAQHRFYNALSTIRKAGYPLVQEVLDQSQEVIRIETRFRAGEPAQLARIRFAVAITLLAGGVVSILLSLGMAQFFTTDILARITRIAVNAHLIAAGKPLPPPQSGSDEIAHLDHVLHDANAVLADARRKEMAILDNAADVICSLDQRLRFAAAGAVAARVWSYSPDELLGMSLLTIVPEESIAEIRSAFQRICEIAGSEGGDSASLDVTIVCGDGALKDFVWTITWAPKELMYYCVAHDVTQMRAVERLKRQFLAIVSHDLRAPLSSTGVSLHLLLDGKKGDIPPGVSGELRKVEASMSRLMALVSELLELEKLESGKLIMALDEVCANDVCAAAIESLESLAGSAGVTLSGPYGDATVRGDERRLVQVVTNLLANAIKFSPHGSVVSLDIQSVHGFGQINVKDRGPGILPEDRDLIFDKFRQSTTVASGSSKIKSSGLGLAIVKAIVEAHGGQVGVESEVGKGSTFWARIPRCEAEEVEEIST